MYKGTVYIVYALIYLHGLVYIVDAPTYNVHYTYKDVQGPVYVVNECTEYIVYARVTWDGSLLSFIFHLSPLLLSYIVSSQYCIICNNALNIILIDNIDRQTQLLLLLLLLR